MNSKSDPNKTLLAPQDFCTGSGMCVVAPALSKPDLNNTASLCKEISSSFSYGLDDSLRVKGSHDYTEYMVNLKLPDVKVEEKGMVSPCHAKEALASKDLTFNHYLSFNNASYSIEGKHKSDIHHKDLYSTSNFINCDIYSSAKCACCPPFPNNPKAASSTGKLFGSCEDLLTPQSFILPQDTANKKRTNFFIVPESCNQASQIPESSSNANSCTNIDVQKISNINYFQDVPPTVQTNNDATLSNSEGVLKESQNAGKSHSHDDEKHFQMSILTPDSFLNCCSARRKLTFDIPTKNGNLAATALPQFKCSLDIPENVYEDISLKPEDSKVFVGVADQKNSIPPIGVFWDIENCRVPKGLSATYVVQAIRNRFFDGYREAEFVCVCDTLKENPKVLEELNDAQVNIMHVGSIVKNAADDKLLQSMRRFADLHGVGASIILISGDSDFATELYDLRYRKGLHIILVHNAHAQDSLKLSAHETALFSEVTQELPQRSSKLRVNTLSRNIVVWNIPSFVECGAIRRRLHFLSSNCGGKSINIQKNSAKISFPTPDLAARAKKRIEGEDVYGSRVYCTFGKPNEKEGTKQKQSETRLSNSFKDFDKSEEEPSNAPHLPFKGTVTKDQNKMDVCKSLWNRSTSSSSNMNSSCCSNWRLPSPIHTNNGNSYNSSPIQNSSSQGSSRGNSPHSHYLARTSETQRTPYRGGTSPILPMKNEFRSLDSLRSYDKGTQQLWSGNVCKGNWNTVHYQPELHSHSPYGLGNLSLAETTHLEGSEELEVTLVDRSFINDLWMKSRRILWEEAKCALPIKEFNQRFFSRNNEVPKMEVLKKDLEEFLQIDDEQNGEIRLVPVQAFARDLLILMNEAGGRMLLINFESAYLNRFGIACRPATLGFPNLVALVQCLGELVTIKGRGSKRIMVLNRDMLTDLPNYSPPQTRTMPKNSEVERWTTYIPCTPAPPPQYSRSGNSSPQTYFQTNGAPPSNFTKSNGNLPPPPSPTLSYDHKVYHNDVSDSHILLGLTPPSMQQTTYQPPSPLIYPGSPAGTNGSVMWGQMWSPQYSVMPPLSPAQYMMPSIPINWGGVTSPAVTPHSKYSSDENKNYRGMQPVSIKTLEQLGKVSPPNPSELPPPLLLTQNLETTLIPSSDQSETENADAVDSPSKGSFGASKSSAKKRLAAQFDVDGKE